MSRITNGFIFIRRIGLLVSLDLGMGSKIILVIEFDGTDNTASVVKDTGNYVCPDFGGASWDEAEEDLSMSRKQIAVNRSEVMNRLALMFQR